MVTNPLAYSHASLISQHTVYKALIKNSNKPK